jgi:hypothetical protein
MSSLKNAILAIQNEISELKDKLFQREIALAVLQETDLKINNVNEVETENQTATVQFVPKSGLIDLSVLRKKTPTKKTFFDEVKSIVARFGDQEFSISETEAALEQLSIEINSKAPKAKISTVLSRLQEEGMLVKTFEGKGNVAHRYKLSEDFRIAG